MNQAWEQQQLEQNEQEMIISQSFKLAEDLGYEGDYKSYEKRLYAILKDPFDIFYEIAKSHGYQSNKEEFRAEFHFLIYQNALQAVRRKG